ncbi:GABA-gated chloride channel [Tropilaelaps mercedesae]|uniref:GABA-gated chloride channel n=1 Tax=Tropilaelaps mercedesae TaxID=418985 RepID=A0A1V9XL91_9ACAR|nr:GABA-gated chloride channel [Tropilaelaps mercedesae]
MEQVLIHSQGRAVSTSAVTDARLLSDNNITNGNPFRQTSSNCTISIRMLGGTPRWSGGILFSFLVLLTVLQVAHSHKARNSDFYELRPGQTERGQNITHILNSFFTKGYDKRVRPNYGGKVTLINTKTQSFIIEVLD